MVYICRRQRTYYSLYNKQIMKPTFLFLCLLAFTSAYSETTICETQALQIVKQTRNVVGNDTANYYIGTVNNVIDEYYCHPSSDVSRYEFLSDESKEKWLVFVDEQPLESWSHNCTYYYIPKSYEGDAPVVAVKGGLPPYGHHLNIVERNINTSPRSTRVAKQTKSAIDHSVPITNAFAGNTRIVFVCVPTADYVQDHYQTVVSAYDILHNTYGIPKSNFYFLISDGTDDPLSEPEYSFSHDIDNDGVDEDVRNATYENLFNTLAGLNGKTEHLFVCFVGQSYEASPSLTFMVLENGQRLNASDFQIMLSAANATYSNVLLSARASNGFTENITTSDLGNTIFTNSSTGGHIAPIAADQHIAFTNTWFKSLIAASSSADTNNDGIISIQEAFDYTNDYLIDKYPYAIPTIVSNPADIASKLAFNSIPTVDLLNPDPEIQIETVSPNPSISTVNIKLSAKAATGSSLVVTSINSSKAIKTIQLAEGEDAASMSLDNAAAGNYAVSLLVNGKVVSSKQIIKY